jgi:hypothetical protein
VPPVSPDQVPLPDFIWIHMSVVLFQPIHRDYLVA